jgi:DNA-directed RNA polymerase alpha subunit
MKITIEANSISELRRELSQIKDSSDQIKVGTGDSITDLGLGVRAENSLKAEGIYTMQDMAAYVARVGTLYRVPNLGHQSMIEVSSKVLAWVFARKEANK